MNYNNLIERLRTEALNKATEATSALGLYLAVESLVTELSEERYRHDRLQDFEVAQAQELERVKKERDAACNEVNALISINQCCGICAYDGTTEHCVKDRYGDCRGKWRGQQKEE